MDRVKLFVDRIGMQASNLRRRFLMRFFYESTLRRKFKRRMGYALNFDNPQTFNEKLQWLKAYYHDPLLTRCADKVAARSYVEEKIGKEYLTPVYGIYNSVNEIDLEALPKEFVLKSNHASGHVILCKDKSKMDWPREFLKMEKWLMTNYFYSGGEWAYKDIKPKIICEQMHSGEIKDYKIVCFNGKPQYLYVCVDRTADIKITYLDLEFKKLPFKKAAPTSDTLEKPKNFEKMIELAGILAKDFPFVRVDFYDIEDKIYFGELTFCPGSGFNPFIPAEWDWEIGSRMDISRIKREDFK